MGNKKFINYLYAAFIAGFLLLVFLQYNSVRNIHNLLTGNRKMMQELSSGNRLRETERDIISAESKIRAAVATGDTSYLADVGVQIDEATAWLDTLRMEEPDPAARTLIGHLNSLTQLKLVTRDQLLSVWRRTGKASAQQWYASSAGTRVANAINSDIRQIYARRMALVDRSNQSINSNGRMAQRWGIVLILLLLISGTGLFLFIIREISRQQQLIALLDASEKKVRETSRVKDNFMANMSHEIRTPLNAILGFTGLLAERRLDKTSQKFVRSISISGESLLATVNDILDLSKIEAGMLRIESAPFSIRELIHSVNALFTEKVKDKGLTLITDIEPGLPDTLEGDAFRLTQILVNLIGNAVKFTEKGFIRISLAGKSIAGNVLNLEVAIADSGIGIEKDQFERIFERFRQAEDDITRRYGGTGLGLAIVRQLILLQKGSIDVDSTPGKGTTFRLKLPFGLQDPHHLPEHLEKTVSAFRPEGSQQRVLVVEDNEMNRSLIGYLLQRWQLKFDIVTNGKEALEQLRQESYGLVLMDLQMPVMDGYTATRIIRDDMYLAIPIVAMTAHAFTGEREKCLSRGMNAYLPKPIREKDLYTLILQFFGAPGAAEVPPETVEGSKAYAYIDTSYMQEISQGDKACERSMVGLFIRTIPEYLLQLSTACASRDRDGLRRTAHNMRTTIKSMGLTGRIDQLLDELEFNETDNAECSETITSLQTICVAAVEEARQLADNL